jgi:c-di-GMP phosphodiesterase
MLQSLIGRWFGRAAPPAASPVVAARRPPQVAAAPVAAATSESAPVVGARRPLVGPSGAIVGFEFHLGHGLRQWLLGRTESAGSAASTKAVLAAMRLCTQGGQQAYVELPAAWLERAIDQVAPGMWLALLATPDDEPITRLKLVAALRGAGARVGWRVPTGAVEPEGLHPDFVVDPGGPSVPGAAGLPWLALNLTGVDSLEAALRAGASLACCTLQPGVEPKDARALPAQVTSLLNLLNRLVRDEASARIVADIKSDVGLSYQLLRHLNNAGVAPGRELASIEQALMMLGRDELFRWVSTMLVRAAPARPAGAALQSQALARARLLELIGLAAGEPQADLLFTFGLASMLPLLMGSTTASVLASLPLPDAASLSLLQQRGPWHPYLVLVEAIERADLEAARPLALPLGGLDRVLELSEQAWQFAGAMPS